MSLRLNVRCVASQFGEIEVLLKPFIWQELIRQDPLEMVVNFGSCS